MALLTAEDVLNKTFPETKFRPGYDQDEVDDFLDEIVNTLRALTAENEDLRSRLAAYESGEAPPVAKAEPAEQRVVETVPEVKPEVVVEPQPVQYAAQPAPLLQMGGEPEAATAMLSLAQKLHDEYVYDGKLESERIVNDANLRAAEIIAEADETSARTLAQLEQERSLLERKIDELRIFERDYRTRLRSYLENLLGDLENRGSAIPNSPLPGQLP